MNRFLVAVALTTAACSGGGGSDDATADTGPTTEPVATADTAQTTVPGTIEEHYEQPPRLVDVLFVIDDSCSMASHQATLASSFPSFANAILGGGADVHIGSTTTSVDAQGFCAGRQAQRGQLVASGGDLWIDNDTPDPNTAFQQLVMVGTDGSGCERGLTAARVALDDTLVPGNAGFVRDDADLHVVVLSDEEDQSGDPAGPFPVEPADMASWLLGTKAGDQAVALHSIACLDTTTPCAITGSRYLEVSDATDGATFDITSLDGTMMESLGLLVLPDTREEIPLSATPDPATLTVEATTSAGVVPLVQGPEGVGDYAISASDPALLVVHPDVLDAGDSLTIRYTPL